MDPVLPINYGPPMPSRRVPPVDRLRRVSREEDRPRRESSERRENDEDAPGRSEDDDAGEGHVDVRV